MESTRTKEPNRVHGEMMPTHSTNSFPPIIACLQLRSALFIPRFCPLCSFLLPKMDVLVFSGVDLINYILMS